MSNELVVKEQGQVAHAITWSSDQVDLLKRTVCKGATDDELKLFLNVAGRTGLDPFSKQIHAVKRWDSKLEREVMSIQTGIDGFRLIAQRSGKYQGQLGPLWCGADGQWVDVWLHDDPPKASKVAVIHADFKEPLWAVATWATYAQLKRDGTPMAMWSKMPDLMLAKVAESLALRKAFPSELSGVYGNDEMAQADSDSTPAKAKRLPEKAKELADPREYVVGFGKWKGQRLGDIDAGEIANYMSYIEAQAQEKGKPITGNVAEFMKSANEYISAQFEKEENVP